MKHAEINFDGDITDFEIYEDTYYDPAYMFEDNREIESFHDEQIRAEADEYLDMADPQQLVEIVKTMKTILNI